MSLLQARLVGNKNLIGYISTGIHKNSQEISNVLTERAAACFDCTQMFVLCFLA